MIFTLIIKNKKALILSDEFHMDSESEVITTFNNLKEEYNSTENQNDFILKIGRLEETLIHFSSKTQTQLQDLKNIIYDAIIHKQREYLLQNKR